MDSQNDRASGISAPQLGASQRTVRAHRYAIGLAPSGSRRIELPKLLLCCRLDLGANAAQFVGETRTVARDVLQHRFQDQAGDGVQIARKGVAAEPQRFQRDRAAAREGIDDERRLVRMCGLDEAAPDLEIRRIGGMVPIREVADELRAAPARRSSSRTAECGPASAAEAPAPAP